MKKTLTVNLGGTVFNIDEDAYRLLDNYLMNLKAHFRKEAGADEIVDDIERRISELLAEKLDGNRQVITLADVEGVIARMGKPEEMDDADRESEQRAGEGYGPGSWTRSEETVKVRRRLFRDPDNKVLGGVCSGLAAYLGWDTTLVRLLLFVILIFGYGTLIPIYIVCWIIIPEARTAAEKLSMHGEAVTVENIGKTVTGGFERMADGVNSYMCSDKPRTLLQRIGDGLVTLAGCVLKAGLIILLIVCAPVLFALGIAFVALLFAAITVAVEGGRCPLLALPHDGHRIAGFADCGHCDVHCRHSVGSHSALQPAAHPVPQPAEVAAHVRRVEVDLADTVAGQCGGVCPVLHVGRLLLPRFLSGT